MALINAENDAQSKRVISEHADLLLTDSASQLLNDWLAQSAGDYARTLQECLALLARCRKEGIPGAFAEQVRPRPPREKVQPAILALVEAKSAKLREQLIRQQQDILLSDAADDFLAAWIENEEEDDVIRNLRECRTLLAKCRDEGIEAAFAHQAPPHPSPSAPPTAELSALVNEIRRLTRPTDMPRRVELCRQALALVARETQPEQWAWLQVDLGVSLVENPLGNRADNLEEAIRNYSQALTVYTSQAYPQKWAYIMNSLGNAYCDRIKGERADNLEKAIRCYTQALTVRTRQAFPQMWASTMNNLATAYSDRIRGAKADNLEQAIRYYTQALTVYTRQAFLEKWAMTINNLAAAYSKRIRGARADNLEEAISYYTQALTVYTRQAFPADWAMTINNLAGAYLYRIRGTRADNLEEAIKHATQALTVYTRQAFPEMWADTMNKLAAAYSNRIRGARADNLEQAISYYTQALTVYTRQAFPQMWASTMNNLAKAYWMRIREARADNLEEAISHYTQALTVYTRQAFPAEWAQTCNNLAAAYSDRIQGARADNLEQAIFHYTQALTVYTPEAFPADWAKTINNLGEAYRNRIRGARADNLEQAISYYRQALTVYTRQAFPAEWAMIMNNLGEAYRERIRGARADNLEEAIKHATQALTVRTRQAFPEKWAKTMNNLAGAYFDRIRGERADNLEQAIKHATEALTVYTRQAFPAEWAKTMGNLANAYSERIRGARALNIEEAIKHATQALTVYTRQAFPQMWASTMSNLALAYSERIRGSRADNLEEAISYYRQALTVYTRQAFPEKWGVTMNNLANVYLNRIWGSRANNVEEAITNHTQALTVHTRQADPQKWAMTMNNLALAYSVRIRGKRADNLSKAISHYRQALTVCTPQAFPQACRNTAYGLGLLLYDEGRFAEARQALVTAHQAVEALRGEVPREGGKKKLAEENADLYARLVFCCLHEGDEKAAFEYAAAGKGRAFVDTLASGGFNMLTAIDSNPTLANDPLLQQYRSLSQEIDNLRLTLNSDRVSADDKERLDFELKRRQSEYERLWEDLTFKYPNLTATVTAPSLTASEAMTLAAHLQATLVEYVEHKGGWSAFVVTKDGIEHVSLDKVDETLFKETSDWIKTLETKSAGNLNAEIERKMAFGLSTTRAHLTGLHDAFIAPLQAYLPSAGQAERLIIAPFGALHQLPMGAAQNPDTKAYLSQAYTLTVTPTLAALRVSLDEARKANWQFSQPKQPLHVAHAGRQGMTNLLEKVSDSEAEMAKMFPKVKLLSSQDANPAAVAKHASGRDLIHFYCHGIFEPDNPNQSGLLLHDGFLTVQRIITDLDLSQTNLTALAACESGRVGVTQGEELVGLIQALLTSGSKAVVATLWKVNESATQAFFQHFYHAIKAGHSPAEALSHAIQAIRQTEDWEHPYFWAAFQISGLAVETPNQQQLIYTA